MSKRKHTRTACARASVCALSLGLSLAAAQLFDSRASATPARTRAAAVQGGGRVDIRLRSLTTRATGKLTVEASEGGGRARLTGPNPPDPPTGAPAPRPAALLAPDGG